MADALVPLVPDLPLLQSSLSLAGRGWHVFPCVPGGKKPALRGSWQRRATTEPARIRAWWSQAAYNIGIACGPSGLVVIDLDIHHGDQPGDPTAATGVNVLTGLCEQHGQPYPLPTYALDTPSGGSHLYYAAPDGRVRNSAGRLGLLIDVRAAGGYVIGAGSRIGERAYTVWDERAPIPMPPWIADLLEIKSPPAAVGLSVPVPVPRGAQGTAYGMAALREEARLVATARPGTRNHTLNRAAFSLGQLVAAGLLPSLVVVSALASAAERAGLPEHEVRRTVRSGMTAGALPARNGPVERSPALWCVGRPDTHGCRRFSSPLM
jgi:Bifunctional DNA primase/polymerase, N-terminal